MPCCHIPSYQMYAFVYETKVVFRVLLVDGRCYDMLEAVLVEEQHHAHPGMHIGSLACFALSHTKGALVWSRLPPP